ILSMTPADGSATNDASARITVSYVDPQISAGIVDVTIAVDGTDFSFSGAFNETTLLWSLPFSFNEGTHTATVQVFDGAAFSANVIWRFTVDTMAPSLSLTSPDYALTRIATTNVSGTTEVGATVTVNGATTGVNPTTGAFSRTILLGEGPNTITVVARDVAGNTAQVTRSVDLDTTPPILTLTVPAVGSRVLTNVVHVAGTTEADATVTVDGISASMASGGDFSVDIVLPDGRYTITAVAKDPAGNQAQLTRTVDVGAAPDTTAPVVTVTTPSDAASVDQASVVVSGTVDDSRSTFRVNGLDVHPAADGSWSVTIVVVAGSNTTSVTATDAAGNQSTVVTRSVTYHSPVPGINQAVTSLSGNLVLGLAIVIVVLVAIVFALYWNLNRKIGDLKPKPPEPPEGGMP